MSKEYQINWLANEIFKSTNHGLDADFLKLVSYAMSKARFDTGPELNLNKVCYKTSKCNYLIDYVSGLPQLYIS